MAYPRYSPRVIFSKIMDSSNSRYAEQTSADGTISSNVEVLIPAKYREIHNLCLEIGSPFEKDAVLRLTLRSPLRCTYPIILRVKLSAGAPRVSLDEFKDVFIKRDVKRPELWATIESDESCLTGRLVSS